MDIQTLLAQTTTQTAPNRPAATSEREGERFAEILGERADSDARATADQSARRTENAHARSRSDEAKTRSARSDTDASSSTDETEARPSSDGDQDARVARPRNKGRAAEAHARRDVRRAEDKTNTSDATDANDDTTIAAAADAAAAILGVQVPAVPTAAAQLATALNAAGAKVDVADQGKVAIVAVGAKAMPAAPTADVFFPVPDAAQKAETETSAATGPVVAATAAAGTGGDAVVAEMAAALPAAAKATAKLETDAPATPLEAKGDSSAKDQAKALSQAVNGDATGSAEARLSPAAERVSTMLAAPATGKVSVEATGAKSTATANASGVAHVSPHNVAAAMADANAKQNQGDGKNGGNPVPDILKPAAPAAAASGGSADFKPEAESASATAPAPSDAVATAAASDSTSDTPVANGLAAPANAPASQNAAQAQPRWAVTAPPPGIQLATHIAGAKIDIGSHAYDIQLDPLELGKVRVRLEVGKDGNVTAAISADRADTLAMLRQDSRSLHQALQEAGLSTNANSLDFSLGSQRRDGGGQAGMNGQSGNGGSQQGNGGDNRRGGSSGVEILAARAARNSTGASRALDIEV